jgi:hypothetical protein
MPDPLATAEGPASIPSAERVLATAVKEEAPFLLEWIAYHKLIGFTRIVVFSNSSRDGTEELLAALARAGEIVHHHVTPRRHQSPQMAAARAFERGEGYRDGAWYMWLDADEFLNIHVGARRLDDLIAAIGPHHGLHVNWRLFGTSGHARFPGRFVSTLFPGATTTRFGANRETKTLFRKSAAILGFAENAVYRPRLATDHGLSAADFLAGNGQPLLPDGGATVAWLAGDRTFRTNIVGLGEIGWALAQINHYSVRTPEFFRLKKSRGRGAGKLRLNNNSRHTEEYFRRFNLNGAKDLTIAVWEDAVTAEIDRLLGLPGVRAAADQAAALVEALLADPELWQPEAAASDAPDTADAVPDAPALPARLAAVPGRPEPPDAR